MATTEDILSAFPHTLGRLLEAAPIKLALAACVTIGGWLIVPGLYQAAVWLLIADWATGTLKANIKHQVNSDAGVRGAVKSLVYLGLLGVGFLMTNAGPIAAEAGQWVALAVLYTELVSNLENLDAIADHYGADVPLLKQAVQILRMKANAHTGGTGPLPPQ